MAPRHTGRRPDRIAPESVERTETRVQLYLDVDYPDCEALVEIERDGEISTRDADDGVASLVTAGVGRLGSRLAELPEWTEGALWNVVGAEVGE